MLAVPTPIIFILAAAIALIVLSRQGTLGDIERLVRAVSPWKLAALLLVYACTILLLGVRWHVLVRMSGGAPRWTNSAEVFLTSVIVNYAAPIGLAVPTRAALTVRDLGLSAGQSGSVVGWELGLDVVALSTISLAWLVAGGAELLGTLTIQREFVAAAGIVAAVAAMALFVAMRAPAIRGRIERGVRPAIGAPVREPKLALAALLLTVVYWSAQLGVMATLLGLFASPPSWQLVLGVMGFPVLIGMISPVPGGAGVREGLMAAVAGLEGVAAGPVVLAAVIYRLALFVVTPLVWGGVRLARTLVNRR
jgi:uncharacterized membrane protein YbhN (UPF0104 family)